MFKFATNKFNSNSVTGGGNGAAVNSRILDESGSNNNASRRRQLQKDLFAFNKIADKGFPSKPSAMDFDKKLRLLAIGTKNGDIRIYGAPGTQQQQLSCYQDVHPFPILRMLFVQGQHQLITLSERVYRNDLTNKGESQLFLVLWQIPHQGQSSTNLVEKIKEYQLESKVVNGSRLSAITLLNDNSHLFLGFETGDVYVFNVSAFQLVPGVINKDYILKNLPDATKKKLTHLGAVESICHHPRQLTKLLIAYQRGLWILFDFIKNQIDQINQTQQQLESAVFYQAGECVATAHSDGSFILWDLESTSTTTSTTTTQPNSIPSCSSNSAPNIVYGPYPCKPVTKCLVKTCRADQPFVIFSGGCPRVNYSDKITISVIQGESAHVCFDFTSKIIDYFTIDKPSVEKNADATLAYDNPQALFVLLEEEFVAIDLVSDGWPQFKLPYLYSVHSSAIICTHYVSGVEKAFYDRLAYYGSLTLSEDETYSEREWPIGIGQTLTPTTHDLKDLLLTGHEDGSIRFWDVTDMCMTLIYKLNTCDYFQTEAGAMSMSGGGASDEMNDSSASDNWPPFRKVGTFDPYSDDPKLGIQKIYLCKETIVVAGTAGQVLVMQLSDQEKNMPCSSIVPFKINLIDVESHFVWKGHEPLSTRTGVDGGVKLSPGYQLHSLIQLYPPATVSALALNIEWQLVSMGTSHGFALVDYFQMKPLLIRCTLDPILLLQAANDSSGGGGGTTISRRKSLKKSLRESFRKLRRGRSQKQANSKKPQQQLNTTSTMRVEHIDDDMNDSGGHRPIERQVESREFKPMDDIPPSVIRYMYFVRTFITSSQQQTNSLWVGTNTGIIYIYALQFLAGGGGATTSPRSINCVLAKEMRLKHRAPVVHIQVIDQNMQPLPNGDKQQQSGISPTEQTNHKVIICSEEQFKVFQLPTLKPVCKFKLTAVEGARVRRIAYNRYTSRADPRYSEYCLSCLSNLGDLSVYSLPQLKRQVQIQCMKQQDINAITSFVFSKQGQAFYLQSPSEFVHISMSARDSPQQLAIAAAATNSTKQAKQSSLKQTSNNKQMSNVTTTSTTKTAGTSSGSEVISNTNTATQQQQQQQQLSSPTSPPPPVPAPRSIANASSLSKDESTPPPHQHQSLSQQPASSSRKLNESIGGVQASTGSSVLQHSTPTAAKTNNQMEANISSPIKSKQKIEDEEIEKEKAEQEKRAMSPSSHQKNTDAAMINVSSTTTTSGLSSVLNNSAVSSSTTAAASSNHNPQGANASILTSAQNDVSFNVSSSGYNGSISRMGVDLSMDSVVDKFNDEFQEISGKKIPPVIDEDSSGTQNDSLLNESGIDLINRKSSSLSATNGFSKAATATVGQINYTFDNDLDSARTDKKFIGNGHSNGHVHQEQDEEEVENNEIDLPPQKASSPLSKANAAQLNTNGHALNGGSSRTKIEQVTKRIENGSKKEYRETVID